MNKIKIDLVFLPSEATGQTIYSENLSKKLTNLTDLKLINPNEIFLFKLTNHFNNSLALKLLPFLIQNKIRKQSVVHITNQELFFLIPSIKNKLIITLCDLSLYSYYKIWKKKDVFLFDKAEKIICISNSTKNELLKKFSLFEKKAEVIYLASEEIKKSSKDVRKKYNLGKNKIILFVGSDDPKKNFSFLLKAFSELKKENLVLVKAGIPWSTQKNQRKKFKEFIEKNNLQNKVKFLDLIPRQDLINLYFESFVYVCPSYYEGFGLTLLEAMSAGIPVISANNTSLPEVAGNSGLFFNADNYKELKGELELILSKEKLRKDLIQKGFQNIKRFNWNKTAKETFEVYRDVLNENKN